MSLIRSAALEGFVPLVSELGGDPELLLERAKIPPEVMDRPNTFIPASGFIRLLEYAARGLDCPDFGSRLSDRQSMGMFGPLAVAMRNSATVGDALACCSRYLFIHSPGANISLHPAKHEGSVLVEVQLQLERRMRAVQATELTVTSVVHLIRRLSGERSVARSIGFRHEPVSGSEAYRRRFGPRVFFGAECDSIEISALDLERPVGGSREDLRGLAESYLKLIRAKPHSSFAAQVSEVVSGAIGGGASSCEEIARTLALHPRTLQRRLREAGTTFEALKDEARSVLAREYLVQRDLPIARTAAMLDYSEQSAFTRSCRRWFGKTPREMRASLLAEQAEEADSERDVSRAPAFEDGEVARAERARSSHSFPRG